MKTFEFISLKHIRRLVLVLFASLTLGCTTTKTVLERHNEIIKTQPGKTHYATAMYVPIARVNQVPSTYQAFLNSACGGQPKRYHYEYKEWLKNLTAFGVGGRNQDEVEAYVIKNCESQTDHICVVQLYNQQDRCAATANDAYFRWKKIHEQRVQQAAQQHTQRLTATCQSFGFQPNSQEMSSCMLELHKSLSHIEAIRNAASTQAAAVSAAAEEARRLREFEQGMALLRGSAGILNSMQPKSPTLQCSYNTIMKTITCN